MLTSRASQMLSVPARYPDIFVVAGRRRTHFNTPILAAGVLLGLFFIGLTQLARGDEFTGTPGDGADLAPLPQPDLARAAEIFFQPLPAWSHVTKMPSLPDQLKPMGKQVVIAVSPPVALPSAPPKDLPAVTSPAKETPKPKTPPAPIQPDPDLIAVSPFLQWIKSDPHAAAEARQQASGDKAPVPSTTGAPSSDAPYWLPPLTDMPGVGAGPSGGSAAIYSTPTR